MNTIFKTFQDTAGNEISGYLEKTNESGTIEKGQVKGSSGWYRTTDINTALQRAKANNPDVDIIKHEHVNFNGNEEAIRVSEDLKKVRELTPDK